MKDVIKQLKKNVKTLSIHFDNSWHSYDVKEIADNQGRTIRITAHQMLSGRKVVIHLDRTNT